MCDTELSHTGEEGDAPSVPLVYQSAKSGVGAAVKPDFETTSAATFPTANFETQ